MARRRKRKSLFLPMVIIAAILAGVYAARGPWQMYSDQKRKVSSMRKELKSLKNSEIGHAERGHVETNPVEMEEKARKEGWTPPGEVPLK